MKKLYSVLFIGFLFAAVPAHALSAMNIFDIFTHRLSAAFASDFNRTLGYSLDLQLQYDVLWRNRVAAGIGAAFDLTKGLASGFYWDLSYVGLPVEDLDIRLKFLSMLYPQYQKSVNSIIPSVQWKYRFVYVEFGAAFRFWNTDPSTFGNVMAYPAEGYEPQFYWAAGVFFEPVPERYELSVELANRDDFIAGNTGAIRAFVRNRLKFNYGLSVTLDAGFQPAGNIALTGNYHHFVVTLGGEMRL